MTWTSTEAGSGRTHHHLNISTGSKVSHLSTICILKTIVFVIFLEAAFPQGAFSFLLWPEFKHNLCIFPAQSTCFFAFVYWHIWGLSSLNKGTFTVCCFLLSDQPNHADEENCVVIRTESSGRWQNRDCSVALPYVCKKRPNATLDPFTTGQYRRECVRFLYGHASAKVVSFCSHRFVGR